MKLARGPRRALFVTALTCLFLVGRSLHHHRRNLSKRRVPPGSPAWASTGGTMSLPEDLPTGLQASSWSIFTRFQQSTDLQPLQAQLLEGVDRDLAPFSQGITLEMVEQAYCRDTQLVTSFRVQILDNQAYIVGETQGYQDLNLKNKRMLASVLQAFPGALPDVDFVVQGSDWIPANLNNSGFQTLAGNSRVTTSFQPQAALQIAGATGSYIQALSGLNASEPDKSPIQNKTYIIVKAHDTHGLLFPDESWLGWAEAKASILSAAKRVKWGNKDSHLLFRGAPTGDREFWLGSKPINTSELDIKLVQDWWSSNRDQYVSPEDQCSNRHLLYFAGYSWASRLKKMLLCGSAVVMHPSPYFGFWWHLLQHGKHVHVMKPISSRKRAAKELTAVVHELQDSEARTKEMAANGQWLAREVLTPKAALSYWQKLLVEYAKLQRFKPTLHPDALTLHASISQPQQDVVILHEARTCSVCAQKRKVKYGPRHRLQ
ncbi:hypothetical protein WJX74_001805 [Apatococcus lobatus]|uniref:Glycosyl transferase CAP10 domain-containing protein n=1 Tax=Apatococcus lobatus TaxID=904363 RepID=A0AAW1QD30_9CHLO